MDELAPDGVFPTSSDGVVFLEPCRIISSAYKKHYVVPRLYYSRSLFVSKSTDSNQDQDINVSGNTYTDVSSVKRNRKRKRNPYSLKPKELLSEKRHQAIRKYILDAHKLFLDSVDVSRLLKIIQSEVDDSENDKDSGQTVQNETIDFIKLGGVWQASLYDIRISKTDSDDGAADEEFKLFKQMVENNRNAEVYGSCAGSTIIMPKKSRFFISDFVEIRQLVPSMRTDGYNLILIDPPWENKSVQRHSIYPTLPNKYLLSLPIKELAHANGALVGLWVTNREKLRAFVEHELFHNWGVSHSTEWYWLKIKSNGEMISELDLHHHKPYECLLLGFVSPQADTSCSQSSTNKHIPSKRVLISIPGDHSRKPPLASLLYPFAPGGGPVKGLELFARELNPEWTSWGNEPIRFQHLSFFSKCTAQKPDI